MKQRATTMSDKPSSHHVVGMKKASTVPSVTAVAIVPKQSHKT
jgi:hypothetical protein